MDLVAAGTPLQPRERPTPQPQGGAALLRTLAAGVCHTDLHLWDGYFDMGGGQHLNMEERGVVLPHTLGHETVGEVVALGPDAVGARIGDRRLVYPWIGCGTCVVCRDGDEQFCAQPRFLGVFRPGGYGDHLLVPHVRYLHDYGGMPAEQAAPLACSGLTVFSALRKIGARIASPVLVIGAGGLGLMAIGMIRAMGGAGAVVADIDPAKRAAALQAGALAAVDPGVAEPVPGGVAAVLDLVGRPETQLLGVASLAKGGTLVTVGMFGGAVTLSIPALVLRGLSLQYSYVGSPQEMAEMMALVRQVGGITMPVTRRPLCEANHALDDLRHGRVIGRTVLVAEAVS